MTSINIQKIYEDALTDPTLLANIDINEILDTLENDKNDYLENLTFEKIQQNIYDSLLDVGISKQKIQDICTKLVEYRYVDEICHLHKGKFVRWMRRDKPGELVKGGNVADIKFLDTGISVLCVNYLGKFIQYRFDDCITFQKLSIEEQLILMAYDQIEKAEDI
jgi:hypothetical protein